MSASAHQPRIRLKPSVVAGLDIVDATVLAEALDQLGRLNLEADARWRVLQIEHCICAKDSNGKLDEP
jgi:hypothetical protein